jgi:hypothetical protein
MGSVKENEKLHHNACSLHNVDFRSFLFVSFPYVKPMVITVKRVTGRERRQAMIENIVWWGTNEENAQAESEFAPFSHGLYESADSAGRRQGREEASSRDSGEIIAVN